MLNKHLRFSPLITASHLHTISAAVRAICVLYLVMSSTSLAQGVPEIYPRVYDEQVPPGGMLQIKVQLTEPEPITTGRTTLAVEGGEGDQGPLGGVEGVALFGCGGDVSGAAVVTGNRVSIRFVSPHGTFGTAVDSPIIAVNIPVRPDARVGQTSRLNLDPTASFYVAPSGTTYAQETVSGVFKVGGNISISNVVPGGGFVPAGSTVTVSGIGFRPQARVEISDVEIASTRYVGPTQLDVVLARSTEMHGKRVQVTNGDRSSAIYYSYLRATPLGQSARPLLAATVPIFSTRSFTQAVVTPLVNARLFTGLGFQNPSGQWAVVTVELFSAAHRLIGATTLTLPPETRIAREVCEYSPDFRLAPGDYFRLRSSVPVQMLGLIGNDADGSVLPLDPIRLDD